MYWFTSDPHFGHFNIIKYCNRPFKNSFEMDQALIENINSKVGERDNLIINGDVSFHGKDKTLEILQKLNGKKHIILGNHDKVIRKNLKEFEEHCEFIGPYLELKVQDPDVKGGSQMICLFHYAQKVWNKQHYGSWQLYGHSHGSIPDDPYSLQMDIGVDCNNMFPFSYQEIKEIMINKKQAIDERNK